MCKSVFVQLIFCFTVIFLRNTEVYGFKNHPVCGKLKNRQIQMPGIPVNIPGVNPIFPTGQELEAYIPFFVTVRLPSPENKLVSMVLVKKISYNFMHLPNFHEEAIFMYKEARNALWKNWENIRKELEDNKIRVSDVIAESRKLEENIVSKAYWVSYPVCESGLETEFYPTSQLLNSLNVGKYEDSDELYPKSLDFPQETEVVGLVVKYDSKNFNTVYETINSDTTNVISQNSWRFVTKYVRSYCIAIEEIDWNNPESWGNSNAANLPPTSFSANCEVN
ncbi:MAG: hypothetical protein PHF08_10560 [Candidatus Riflebacteria bacterium]|nr:hypothetical protein [Candidatus Riflebacteria bacterium]